MKNSTGRIYELDALRFLAAASVMLYHLTYRLEDTSEADSADAVLMFPELAIATRFGYLGVNLFFMISGFVILWSASEKNFVRFFSARIARLYPTFWASIFVTLCLVLILDDDPFSHSLIDIMKNMTMIGGYLGVEYIDGVYWTLQVELKFYFLIVMLILLRQVRNIEAWLIVWLITSYLSHFAYGPKILSVINIYPYSAYFIAGCVFYLVRTSGLTFARVCMILLSLYLAMAHSLTQTRQYLVFDDPDRLMYVAPFLIMVAFVIFTSVSLGFSPIRQSRNVIFLGALTYPLYLIHNVGGKLIFGSLNEFLAPWVALVVTIIVCLIISSAIVVLIENRLKYSFSKQVERGLLYASSLSKWRFFS